jgi:hypothetical protein
MDGMNMLIATGYRRGALRLGARDLNGISTTFVVYNPKSGGVRDKTVGDTDITGNKVINI